jgi:hypothetical protein
LPSFSFRDLERVCKALGLESRPAKKGTVWSGISPLTNAPIRPICIHTHARGRDVPTGTLVRYVKNLGFENLHQFTEFLSQL